MGSDFNERNKTNINWDNPPYGKPLPNFYK